MNDTDPEALGKRIADLERGMKIGFLSVLAVISYFNIRTAYAIPASSAIFHDMLGDAHLPYATAWVVNFHEPLLILSLALPVLGLATLCMKPNPRSMSIYSAVMLLAAVQVIFTGNALMAPLIEIISKMSNGGS